MEENPYKSPETDKPLATEIPSLPFAVFELIGGAFFIGVALILVAGYMFDLFSESGGITLDDVMQMGLRVPFLLVLLLPGIEGLRDGFKGLQRYGQGGLSLEEESKEYPEGREVAPKGPEGIWRYWYLAVAGILASSGFLYIGIAIEVALSDNGFALEGPPVVSRQQILLAFGLVLLIIAACIFRHCRRRSTK